MRGLRLFQKIISFLFLMILMPLSLNAQDKASGNGNTSTVISIVNAQKTTYTKVEETGNDSIVLEGAVEISVKKGDTTSEIKADVITYDRKTEMLYARGNVEITTKGSNSGGETTTANSLLLNTSTLEGVFDGGRVVQTKSDALNLPSGSTLIVFSDLFGKSESNTISFKNSSLTFCDDEDPHWHIDATRTWLLPGGEFAFFNALLYVGKTPVLYLPAFYYPKDELIFNPVFTTYKRKGYAIQNTYYIIGRKPLNSSSSSSSSSSSDDESSTAESLKALYNFMKPTTLKEQERQGLILHNLDENYGGNTSKYLKIFADYYSNLGYMAGVDGVFQPSQKYVTSLKFNANLGFSKTIFKSGDTYTTISTADQVYWDKSNFMGIGIPFRYGTNFDMTLSKPFKLTLSMPLYSDPYFYYDFMQRNESMDWISYFLSNDNDDTSSSTYSSFKWNLSSSYSPTLPAVLKPYISSLSFSLTSSINFATATAQLTKLTVDGKTEYEGDKRSNNNDSWTSYTPERNFYYPSQITPADVKVSMSGTLFEWPKSSSASSKTTSSSKKDSSVDSKKAEPLVLIEPEELKITSVETKDSKESTKKEAAETTGEGESDSEITAETSDTPAVPSTDEPLFINTIADLPTSVSSVTKTSGLTYKLGYTIAPTLTTQFAYDVYEIYEDRVEKTDGTVTVTEKSKKYLYVPEDFDWTKIKSFMYTYKMPTSLSSSLTYGGSFFSMTNKLSYDPIWQDHPNVDGVIDSQRKSLALADYKARSQAISESNTVSFKPFAYVPAFSDTGISWNTTLKLFRMEFKGTSSDENWEEYWSTSDAWDSYWIFKDYNDDSNWTDDIDKLAFQQKFITANTLNVTLGANERNSTFKQNLTYSLTMPPQYWKHNFSLNLTFPYVTGNIAWSASQKSTDADSDGKLDWTMNNLTQALTISLFNSSLKLSESYSIITDPDAWNKRNEDAEVLGLNNFEAFMNHSDSFKLSLTWKKLTAAYTMSYTTGYDLDKEGGTGWNAREKKQFLPYSMSLSYSPASKTYYRWSNKLSFAPALTTSVTADLVRATNSYFLFNPSLNFKVNDLLNISFSASSRNSTLYWYFQGKDSIYSEDLGNNFFSQFFLDLARSFGIGKNSFMENRQASGFKLKSLNMTASHDLHDWSFNMTWKFEPKLVKNAAGRYEYNFDPYISIGVVWNPMESMKTVIVHEYDTDKKETVWELNP